MKELRLALAIFLALFGGPLRADATLFKATVSGDILNGATYGGPNPGVQGTDYPAASGDAIVLNPTVGVSLASNESVSLSSMAAHGGTTTAHSSFTIAGALTMTGPTTMGFTGSGYVALIVSTGGSMNIGANNIVTGAGGSSFNYLWVQGTQSSPASLTSLGGTFTQGAQGGFNNVDLNFNNANITGLGPMGFFYGTTGADWQVNNTTFTACGRVRTLAQRNPPSSNVYMQNSNILYTSDASGMAFRWTANAAFHPTGRNEIINSVIGGGTASNMQIDATSVTMHDNIFWNFAIIGTNGSALDQDFQHNIMFSTVAILSGASMLTLVGTDTVKNNFFYANIDNPHWLQNTASSTQTYAGNIFETNNTGSSSDDGDILLDFAATGASSGAFTNNIHIGKKNSSVLLSEQGSANTVGNHIVNNNTNYWDPSTSFTNDCTRVGETYGGRAGYVLSIQNNLCMTSAVNSSAWITRDQNVGAATDKIVTDNFNGSFNMTRSGLYQPTKSAGSYGANDITNVNPHFVNGGAELLSWDIAQGGSGTEAHVLGELLKVNGFGGPFNPKYNVANLINYLNYAYMPQNFIYHAAGFDGSDIGAITLIPENM